MKKMRLGEVFNLQMGKTPARENLSFWSGTNKWISISDIGNSEKYISSTKESITDEAVQKSGIKIVPKGTVIMSFKLSIGKVAITSEDMYSNEAIMAFIDKKICHIDTNYLYYLLGGKDWNLGTNKAVMGLTLNKATLSQIEIEIPPIEKQIYVSSVLDKVSDLIALRKQQLAKLDELVKARFVEIFGDPIENPKGWKVKTIKEVVASQKNAIKAGPFGSALKKEFYCSKGYKIYGQEQVINGDVNFGDYYISEEKYQELKSCSVQSGDVLISLVGTYGKSLIIPQNFQAGIINPRLIKITFDKTLVNVVYFQYYFSSNQVKNYLDEQIHGCTMGVLNLGIISALCMPLPPLALQNEFALYVEKIDKTKVDIKKSLEELNLLKKSLMQEYFG